MWLPTNYFPLIISENLEDIDGQRTLWLTIPGEIENLGNWVFSLVLDVLHISQHCSAWMGSIPGPVALGL